MFAGAFLQEDHKANQAAESLRFERIQRTYQHKDGVYGGNIFINLNIIYHIILLKS